MRELKDRHYRAIEMMVAGLSNVVIAERLGVSSSTISVWKRDSRFFEEYLAYRTDFKERVEEAWSRMFPLVYRTLEELLRSDNEFVKLRACDLWLRSVGKVIERITLKHEFSLESETEEELKSKIQES
jgi:hypothetical protein